MISTLGFGVWLVAPNLGVITVASITIPPWIWIFVGLLLAQGWKSFSLGATFAVVKQATDPSRLAAGFASTETFRRTAFLIGPVLAAVLIGFHPDFTVSFQYVLAVAVVFGIVGTVTQHVLYDASEDSIGDSFEGVDQIRRDLREMPEPLRPLLVGDTLVRFANGMVYVFFVLVITQFYQIGFETTVSLAGFSYGIDLSPEAFFGYLLGVEMLIALLSMAPAAKAAERVGLKPVVALGFVVYALFPVVLISGPEVLAPVMPLSWAMILIFAFSGLRRPALTQGIDRRARRARCWWACDWDVLFVSEHDCHPERRARRLSLGVCEPGNRIYNRSGDRCRWDWLLPYIWRGVRSLRLKRSAHFSSLMGHLPSDRTRTASTLPSRRTTWRRTFHTVATRFLRTISTEAR